MNFKKKRSFRDLVQAALVVVLAVGVPTWLFMICLITGSVLAFVGLVLWISLGMAIGRRFE